MILTMKHIIRRVLLLVVMMLSISWAYATPDNGSTYFENADNFDAYSMGNGKIHFKVLIFAEGEDHNYNAGAGMLCKDPNFAEETGSRIRTTVQKPGGGESNTIFIRYRADNYWNAPGYTGGKQPRDAGRVWFYLERGVIDVTNTYNGVVETFTASEIEREVDLKRSDSGDHLTFFEFDWYPPMDLDSIEFEVSVTSDHHKSGGCDFKTKRHMLGTYTGASSDRAPQLNKPFFYAVNEAGAAGYGKAAVVYVSVNDVEKYTTSLDPNEHHTDQNTDIIYVDTKDTVQHGFRANFYMHRGTDKQPYWIWSNRVDIPAYHKIHDFKISNYQYRTSSNLTFIDDRVKQISWKIYYPKEEDLVENDMFEIQRAYMYDFSDAESIGLIQMAYDSLTTDSLTNIQTYTFVDSTEAAWWNPIENNYTIYYRVRRVSSSQWGWIGHDYAIKGYSVPDKNYYPMPFSDKYSGGFYTLAEDFEKSRKLDITIRLFAKESIDGDGSAKKPAYDRFYWDDNQTLKIRKVYKELQDTVYIEIPSDSIKAARDRLKQSWYTDFNKVNYIDVHYSDVANTPCVHYEYSTVIDTTGVIVKQLYGSHNYTEYMPITGDSIYFTEAANLETLYASKGDYSDGVLLRWQTTDGNVGSYKIETRPAGKDTAWTVLVDNYDGNWFKDREANPFISLQWDYRLTMTYECNGIVKSQEVVAVGSRNPYGKVSGYVRYEDGSACPNITVTASRTSTGKTVQTVTTDENGYYLLDSLIYGEGYAYSIQPTSMSAEFQYNNTSSPTAAITLGLNDCVREGVNFANISSVPFSGRVLFENSTIPVRDVQFLLNGIPVKSGTSYYKTDASGNFEFRVPLKSPFTLQAYKEGHIFDRDGFVYMINKLTQKEDSLLSLDQRLPGVRIYDQTKVRIIGRLCGGNDQAEKPLGFGVSQNNLGDDLKLVLELEGDNISQIVHFNDDLLRDSVTVQLRHDVLTQEGSDSVGITRTEYYKKRIIIYPDVNTGEYYVDLFPVKYKITQATAKGYATLYAQGKTGETLDLIEAPLQHHVNTYGDMEVYYNGTYNITYHSPIAISCRQLQFGMPISYYGEKTITRQNILNEKIEVPVVEMQPDGSCTYLFGAPVFNSDTYQFSVTAHEDYYYNNDLTSSKHEEVRLRGGTLKVYNGLHDAKDTEIQTHQLDTNGRATIALPVDYVSFVKTGENALRVLDLSVEYQGAYIESQAFRAYVTGDKLKGQEYAASTHGDVILLDILRDPPGSGSTAYLDAGSSYSYNCNTDLKLTFGMGITLKYGSGANIYMGAFAGMGGGVWSGMPTEVASSYSMTLPITNTFVYKHNGTYTFQTTERITTAGDPFSVGADADVYIGATQNVLYGAMDAVQPLDSLTYVTLAARAADGTMRTIAEGRDANGQKYYLVIGTEFGATSYISSTFVHTQSYIEQTLLPQLVQMRNSLLMTGDSATVAGIAIATNKPAYWSKVGPEDENFGMDGYYEMIVPDGEKVYDDEVAAYNRQFVNWFSLLIKNEREKINALRGSNSQLVGTWSTGGATTVTHTETYNSSSSEYFKLFYPGLSLKGSLPKGDMNIIQGDRAGMDKLMETAFKQKDTGENKPLEVLGKTSAATWKFEFTPIINADFNMSPATSTHGHSKTASFTLKNDDFNYSHLNVSVYRVVDKNNKFNDETDDNRDFTGADSDYRYGSYVYFVNGGATRCPWQGPDSTRFYTPKVPLSAGTLKLENPKLDIDVHERSNVPVDQPAVFNIQMSNEGEVPYGSGTGMLKFELKVQRGTNPKGARILIDGVPLTEEAREFGLTRGSIMNKRVEVYAGEGYDFENITLALTSTCSMSELARCTFSVHYMPVACPVNISAPHDKWIMNTLSPQDSTGWYLPVVIDGFDVNYKNFDHIEFQYKLSTRSDEEWINLCSYYANDSLFALASGNKAMISGGRIENVRFYGERDPMEQEYDLRAVAFCRHGNGFITRASEVMRGIKDTRVPRVFGEAEPANSILGVGDKLLLRFNEPIAGNYLDEDNNFQVIGYTNETGISTGISLHFIDTEKSYAESKVLRSISDKSFTVDMMVRPQDPEAEYTFFNYDTKGRRRFSFGKTADNRLFAKLGSGTIYSDTLPEKMIGFTRVAVVYDRTNHLVRFYAGTKEVTDTLIAPFEEDIEFNGSAPISIGKGFAGNMMEVRLWTKALAPDEITQTYMTRLTGYERELVAYYPMDEGKGSTLADKANGATLYTYQANWEYQKGISLRVKDGQIVKMNDAFLSRSNKQDETLMFWFKTPSKNGTIFSAGRLSDKQGTELVLSNGNVFFRSYENEWKIDGDYSDNSWHHFALTINRAFNNASVYLDDKQKVSTAATKIGEVSGEMYLGGAGFDGNIDEFIIFEQALPQALMETYGTTSPRGDEMGLMAYLPFVEMKENDNGILEQVFSINDQRVFRTSEGDVVEKVQPLIVSVSDSSDVMSLGDRTLSAPVQDIGQLTKMNFDWSFNNDELLINLNMRDREINKQTIYITVRDVEDLNGNPMASPVTWTTFVDRNAIKWAKKEITAKAIYGKDESVTRTIRVVNYSGKRHQYTVESLPDWLSVDAPSGAIEPTDEITLTLTFDANIAVGLYSDVIYLTDEDGLSEPLRIEFNIEAIPPYDGVDKGKYPLNMSVCAQVLLDESVYDTDPSDIVYALYRNECVGKENVTFDDITNTSKAFITVYGNDDMNRQPVRFQLWQASTGKVFDLTASRNILFEHGYVYGCDDGKPIILMTSGSEMQHIAIEKGWNWISLNLDLTKTGGSMAACMTANDPWVANDKIKNTNSCLFSDYDAATGYFVGTLETLHFSQTYMVLSAAGNTIRIAGEKLPEDSMKISVSGNGKWNPMPCLFDQATPLTEALAGYYDNATQGDLIKAHDRFATFTANKRWEGNLTALRPGEGYLFRRMAPGTVTIPFYRQSPSKAPRRAQDNSSHPSVFSNPKAATNMTVIAKVQSDDVQCTKDIRVYVGDELAAVATPLTIDEDTYYFLTIQSDKTGTLRFEMDGQTLQPENGAIMYSTDSHAGSLKAPIMLRPADETGVYKIIENNHVVIIRNNEKYDVTGKKL